MGGRGPAPKEALSRPRDEARRRAQMVLVTPDDQVRGPELPDGYEWPEETREWWETWRRSPQAQTWLATDWSFLLDTALLHADFWLGDRSVEAGLRLRVAKFGATPEDRLRLRIAVTEPTVQDRTPNPRLSAARKRRMLADVDRT
jgi:hypothetical protein